MPDYLKKQKIANFGQNWARVRLHYLFVWGDLWRFMASAEAFGQ